MPFGSPQNASDEKTFSTASLEIVLDFTMKSLILSVVATAFLSACARIPAVGKSAGLVTSGVLLSSLIALVSYVFVRYQKGLRPSHGLIVGAFWLCLTLAFEFSFGRFAQHKPWVELMDAYTFKDGNIWPVALFVTLVAPYLSSLLYSKLQHVKSGA